MSDCRTLIDRPRSGAWNMAFDEVLVDRAVSERRPQLRIYSWEVPTLSLGYFQRVAERARHRPSSACPLVRRPSGGGAIVHDQEVTYALAIPASDRIEGAAVYRRVHAAFVAMLGSLGINAAMAEATSSEKSTAFPLLCFQRHAAGDVVIDRQKVVGSAQRRQRSALLQHGSVLLQASCAAPELPGILDLAPVALRYQEWVESIRQAILHSFGWSAIERNWTNDETELARNLVEGKYSAAEWNERR